MSDVPFDPSTAADLGGTREPTEEEIRAYLSQLREAPVDQVLAEVVNALLNAAQVKLGRRDGRLLIDTVAAVSPPGSVARSPDSACPLAAACDTCCSPSTCANLSWVRA